MKIGLPPPVAAIAAAAIATGAAFGATAAGFFDGREHLPQTRIQLATPAPTISIAPLEAALTFARTADGRTVAVFAYQNGKITAAPLGVDEDAISFVNRIGYGAAKGLIETLSARIEIDAATLAVPVDLGEQHIAAGTNYRDHAKEASVKDGPFLFPKYVTPTPSRAPVTAGNALLDYEVELCLVAMAAIAANERAKGGLILCNDFTDRARLLREIDTDDPRTGEGFTSGKSTPGYLPVGDLFIVPRDLDMFVSTLTLELSVNGEERQKAPATMWIWDFDRVLNEARAKSDVSWNYWGGAARLPFDEAGAVPARAMILGGTPGGTIFKGIYPSAYLRGVFGWIAGGFKGSPASRVVESHIKSAQESGGYLERGDVVSIDVDRMGALRNRIE